MNALVKFLITEIVLMLVITGFVCCLANFREAVVVNQYNLYATDENKNEGELLLTDTYDSEKTNLYDFFSKRNSLDIMNNTYELLTDAGVDYYEISNQPFAYLGNFNLGKEFTAGDDIAQINQIDEKGQFYTPLKSLQISEFVLDKWNLYKQMDIHEDEIFKEDSSEKISVVMGSKYKNFFNYGDDFSIVYLGQKQIDCLVKGFLKENTYVEIDGGKLLLDEYIISNNLTYDENDSDEYKKSLMSVKCEGFLHYESKKECQNAISLLLEIRDNIGFSYEIPIIKKECSTIGGIGPVTSGALFFIVVIGLILVNTLNVKKMLETKIFSSKYCKVFIVANVCCISIIAYSVNYIVWEDYRKIFKSSFVVFWVFVVIVCLLSIHQVNLEERNR